MDTFMGPRSSYKACKEEVFIQQRKGREVDEGGGTMQEGC